MSMFKVAKDIVLDVAKDGKDVVQKCMHKASETLEGVVDNVSEKVEYYTQKEKDRTNLERLKNEYTEKAVKFVERLIASRISTKSPYYKELQDLRNLKIEYEISKIEFESEYGDNNNKKNCNEHICKNCGQVNDFDAIYCINCGTLLE